jgi:integrase
MQKQPWEGGYIRTAPSGRRSFYIEKRLDGQRFHFSLQTGDHEVALREYRRFRDDPNGYELVAPVAHEKLLLTMKLVEQFLTWSRDEKKNTPDWVRAQRRAMGWWAGKLFGRDLRRLSLSDVIKPALKDAPGRRQKVAVLKAFYAWLRAERHLIALAQDPVAGALRAPVARPEQWVRSKVIPREHVDLVRGRMPARYNDALEVLSGTGWHKTELVRFADDGAVEPVPRGREAEGAAVLLCPHTKGGAPLRTIVSKRVAAAARRLLAAKPDQRAGRGRTLSEHYLNRAIADAVAEVNAERAALGKKPIEKFTAGRFRHTVATWAIEAGAPREAVAAFLGHKSWATTQRFYATLAAPPKVPTLR